MATELLARERSVSRCHPGVRAWHGGKTPPDEQLVQLVETADASAEVLYDGSVPGGDTGAYSGIVKGLYGKMDSLKRSPAEFRTWTEEDGMETFVEALLDIAPPDLRNRVQVLQQVGTFRFRSSDGPDEKKAKISAVFAAPQEEGDSRTQFRAQAKRLAGIWSATPDSLLDYLIARPAQVGRVMSDRLSPAKPNTLKLIGHPFTDVRSTVLQPLADARLLAYERSSEIHLLTAVQPVLANWDADTEGSGCRQITLLEALILHELAEVILDETTPDLPPLPAHIVATTFERFLKGTVLSVAVEDFFLSWPQPSTEELAERRQVEMVQQLEEARAFFAEDTAPQGEEDSGEELPLDPSAAAPRSPAKKRVLKKKTRKA